MWDALWMAVAGKQDQDAIKAESYVVVPRPKLV